MRRVSQANEDAPTILYFIAGFIFIILGGIGYAFLTPIFIPHSVLSIIIGTTIFLQSSRAFQVTQIRRLIIVIMVSAIPIIFIDFWPLQHIIAQIVSTTLLSLNVPDWLSFTPHFGGAQISVIVQELGTGRLVGGEIDNACAGLIVLFPCLLLLFLADKSLQPPPDRLNIGLITVSVIGVGNLIRIVFELWAPASIIVPFEVVHYPLAFILGIFGLIFIVYVGNQLVIFKNSE
jgi:exosortase/archaeosortase family protein